MILEAFFSQWFIQDLIWTKNSFFQNSGFNASLQLLRSQKEEIVDPEGIQKQALISTQMSILAILLWVQDFDVEGFLPRFLTNKCCIASTEYRCILCSLSQ